MSTPTAAAPPDAPAATSATALSEPALSGLRRLHPVDGLFLRAEHLAQIQDYSSELNRLSAMAAGSGTVHGYELDLELVDRGGSARVVASPGLAVSAEGRLLRSQTDLTVDLGRLELDVPYRMWVVEVVPADPVLSGHEPAYSSVCATSCGPGSSIHPWQDDAVRLRVRAETLEGSWWGATRARRSELASAWFEKERQQGTPWLTPGSTGQPVPSLLDRPWSRPAPAHAPSAAAVPLGLLFRDGDRWEVDVWSARRDRVEAPPQASWLPRLSMRSWSTYLAQVLQFEDHVARLDRDAALEEQLVELPPGGFLDVSLAGDDGNDHDDTKDDIKDDTKDEGRKAGWAAKVRRRMGSRTPVRFITCTADVAVSAVALAQHLDRIPLRDGDPPAIDVWIPDIPADLPSLRTPRYGWVAFTRGVQLGAAPEAQYPPRDHRPSVVAFADAMTQSRTAAPVGHDGEVDTSSDDEVGVHLIDAPRDRGRYAARVDPREDEAAGTVHFESGGWRLASRDGLVALRRLVEDVDHVELVACAPDADREPLLVARARVLADELGLGEAGQTAVYAVHAEGPEAVYLMVRSRA